LGTVGAVSLVLFEKFISILWVLHP
jgi:hypothetical protein